MNMRTQFLQVTRLFYNINTNVKKLLFLGLLMGRICYSVFLDMGLGGTCSVYLVRETTNHLVSLPPDGDDNWIKWVYIDTVSVYAP